MAAFEDLLRIQEHDTVGDQLRHRIDNLPGKVELSVVEGRLAALAARIGELRSRQDAVAEVQGRREGELAAVDERITEVERRMYSGEVSASRELQAMLVEVEHLKSRRSHLEDEALSAMEEGEPLAAEVMALEAEVERLEAERASLSQAIAEEEQALGAEMAAEEEEREQLAEGLPKALMDTYERLRSKHGGVGAARLVGNSCTGCHLTLPLSEVDRIKREAVDALVLCDQCGRILVR